MRALSFVKMQGLGNDFILAEGQDVPADVDLPELARRLCDRHFGIGADGLILNWPSERGAARMQILNADGSEPEMCGNGLRCFVRYRAERGQPQGPIETGAGLLQAELRPGSVRVDMGPPELEAARIPSRGFRESPVLEQALACEGEHFLVSLVSMGNPHCVIRVDEGFDLEAPGFAAYFERWGPLLERHLAFPARINVEFVQVLSPRKARVKVWERGAGATLACGTGACAVVVAGALGGWLEAEAEIELPGGSLAIEWPERDGSVWMEGPAETVYRGEYELKGSDS